MKMTLTGIWLKVRIYRIVRLRLATSSNRRHGERVYATEICKRLLAFAFEETSLVDVVACIDDDNDKSRHVLCKCGLRGERRRRAYGEQSLCFRITREQWVSQKPNLSFPQLTNSRMYLGRIGKFLLISRMAEMGNKQRKISQLHIDDKISHRLDALGSFYYKVLTVPPIQIPAGSSQHNPILPMEKA